MTAALRARFAHRTSGQVLVTFRGVAVEESLVRYVQMRASELGLTDADTLHVVLSAGGAGDSRKALACARVGSRSYEHGSSGAGSQTAVQAALDALRRAVAP